MRPPKPRLRLYEWRDGNGRHHHGPQLAENASAFHAWSLKNGIVGPPLIVAVGSPEAKAAMDPSKCLYIFVCATGERVGTQVSACRTKCRLEPGLPWFNADGLEVA